jgi:hypothetical protein
MAISRRLSAILWATLDFVLVVIAAIQIYRIREPLESVRQAADLLPVLPFLATGFLCSVSAIYAVRRAFREPTKSGRKGDEAQLLTGPGLN